MEGTSFKVKFHLNPKGKNVAQDKQAREANRFLSVRDPQMMQVRNIPRGMNKNVRVVLKGLWRQLKDDGVKMPYDADPVSGAITYALVKTATQDVSQFPAFYCPKCRRMHKYQMGATCPVHSECTDLEIIVPEAKLQSNSVQAASKLMDKLYPNLSAVNATVNIEGKIELLVDKFVSTIIKFVPGDQRQSCMSELNQIVLALRNSDDDAE